MLLKIRLPLLHALEFACMDSAPPLFEELRACEREGEQDGIYRVRLTPDQAARITAMVDAIPPGLRTYFGPLTAEELREEWHELMAGQK
jgi:hypothetical protein